MDPITAMTLGSIGLSAFGSLRSASAQRKQMRQQAALERERVAELQFRAEQNIQEMKLEGQFAQRQAQATLNASGAMGGGTALAHMTNIANKIAKEASIVRRETDFAVRAGLSQADAMSQQARGGFLDTVNILAGAGLQAEQTMRMRPKKGEATPRQQRQFQQQSGNWTRPNLLEIGSN